MSLRAFTCIQRWVLMVQLSYLMLSSGQQIEDSIRSTAYPDPFELDILVQLSCQDFNPLLFQFLHWVLPNSDILQSSIGRFELMAPFPDVVTLTINNARQSDEGNYKCVFNRISDQQMVAQVVFADFVPSVVINTPTNLVYRYYSGATAHLLCDPQNHNSVQWQNVTTMPASAITSVLSPRVRVDGTDLIFTYLHLGDSGEYKCVAKNQVDIEEIIASLYVYEKPSVSITPALRTVNISAQSSFSCEVSGHPTPTVHWTKDDTDQLTISEGGAINIRTEKVDEYTRRYILIFNSVTKDDTGTYRCSASNDNGTVSATASLQLFGTPSAPQSVRLEVVDHVDIQVSWEPPEMDGNSKITSYTVMWLAQNGTVRDMMSHHVLSTNQMYHIPHLEPLTTYSVTVYASNMVGRGRDSDPVNVTTDPTVPGAPMEVTFTDVRPNSVVVMWTLSANSGGTRVTAVRIYWKTAEQGWDDLGDESNEVLGSHLIDTNTHLIDTLRSNTEYQIRVEAVNRIGSSEAKDSEKFRTPPQVYPVPPGLVQAKNLTDRSAVVCWMPNEIGMPFTSYTITGVQVNDSSPGKVWKPDFKSVTQLPDGSEAFMVTGIKSEVCYQFTVTVHNDQGASQPSAPSDARCTTKVSTEVTDTRAQGSSDSGPGSDIIAVLVVCGVFAIFLLVVAVVLVVKISTRLRRRRKSYEYPHKDHRGIITDPSSTQLEPDMESSILNPNYYGRQSSTGNYSMLSQNSVNTTAENSPDTPQTSMTVISNVNPFVFPTAAPPQHNIAEPPHTLLAHQHHGMAAGGMGSVPWLISSQTLPAHNQMHSIHKTHSLPSQARWAGVVAPQPFGRNMSVPEEALEDCDMMTENPLNQQFEQKMAAELVGRLPEEDHELTFQSLRRAREEIPVDPDAPPIPPYLGESASEASLGVDIGGHAAFQIAGSDEEEEVEFTENDAYETVNYGSRSPPRFAITSQVKGAVFDTVEVCNFRQD